MDELLSEAVDQTLALGPDRSYGCISDSAASCAPLVLQKLGPRGNLHAWCEQHPPLGGGGPAWALDERLEIHHGCLGDAARSREDPGHLAGVLVHLQRAPNGCTPDGTGASVEEWLGTVSPDECASALDAFGSLRDELLSRRIAERLLLLRRGPGGLALQAGVEAVLEDLRPEFAESHPNLQAGRILRAMEAASRREPRRLAELLEAAFRRLEMHGRCTVVTFNPWELTSLRAFMRDHEEPSSAATTAIPRSMLTRLYPLLASGKDYLARRVSKPLQTACDELTSEDQPRAGMLHVLEKAPRSGSFAALLSTADALEGDCGEDQRALVVAPPPPPDFGGRCADRGEPGRLARDAEGPREPGDSEEEEEEEDAAGCAELDASAEERGRLQAALAARKAVLREAGQGAALQRKDPEIAALTRQLNELHCVGRKYTEKVHRRARDLVHVSVLLSEAIEETMALGPHEVYVDCTFGRGGHSRLMLSRLSERGRLKAFDVDPRAVEVGRGLERADARFQILHSPFGDLAEVLQEDVELGGVLLDLGVSSPQLDDSSRGFSRRSRKSGPLDLRMNPSVGVPAAQWLQTVTVGELAWVISSTCYRLDPPIPERIAAAILEHQRRNGPFGSTAELAALLEEFSNELGDERPKTSLAHLVFCAIRVFLNREMEQLALALEGAFQRLKPSGRCVVICFTRWEMAAVRHFLRTHEEPAPAAAASLPPERLRRLYPWSASGARWRVRQARRPVRPTAEEIARNQRAKSLMYVLEKVPR